MRKDNFGCRVSCTGLNAEISHLEGNPEDVTEDGAMIVDSEVFSQLRKDYEAYKSNFVRNIKFNATSPNLGNNYIYKTWQELRMLSSVTINCQVTKIVMNSGSQLSVL